MVETVVTVVATVVVSVTVLVVVRMMAVVNKMVSGRVVGGNRLHRTLSPKEHCSNPGCPSVDVPPSKYVLNPMQTPLTHTVGSAVTSSTNWKML